MIAAAIKGHSSSDMGTPDTKWYYFIASESYTTAKTQDNLRIAGADIILCGTKKGAVDIQLKDKVNDELLEIQSRDFSERKRMAVLISSGDSDFAREIRQLKTFGVRVGIVCGDSTVKKTYKDLADFVVQWPIEKVKDVINKEPTSYHTSTSVTGAEDPSNLSDEYRVAWCDAISDKLEKGLDMLDKCEEITLPLSQLGQIAAPLKPADAPKSLKLEATIREDKKRRFKFSGEGTEVIVTFIKSRGGRGGKGGGGGSGKSEREGNNSSVKSQAPLKGSVETSSDALRVQWCNSIFSKLFKEFQVEGGLSLSTLGTLASALRPVGGDSLRLEASLSEDSRFILVKGKEGTFAKLRGGKKRSGKESMEKEGSKGGGASHTKQEAFRTVDKEKGTKKVHTSNDNDGSGANIDQLRELWCDEIARVLDEELEPNEEVFVSSLGVLVSSLRPPGGEGLKLEASLRADSRFEVQGKGLEAVVRLILIPHPNDNLIFRSILRPCTPPSFAAAPKGRDATIIDDLVKAFSMWPLNSSQSVNQLTVMSGSPIKGTDPDLVLSLIKKSGKFIVMSIDEVYIKKEEKMRYRQSNNLGDDVRDIIAAQQEEEESIRRIRRLEEEKKREDELKRMEQLKPLPKKTGQWVNKGKEGQYITLPAWTLVRYGVGNRWVESTIKLGFPFLISNEAFKVDPAPGEGKFLEVWEAGK
jgi:hypothetical protein